MSHPPPSNRENPPPIRHGDRRQAVRRDLLLPAVRVSAGEHRQIDGEAASLGLALTAYVRRLILGRRLPRPVPAVNRELWARLGPLGADLNGLAAAMRDGRAAADPLPLLEALRQEIATLRAALVGDDSPDR
jgi:hypothetical protein